MNSFVRLGTQSLWILLLVVIGLGGRVASASPVCQTDTLADYINLNAGGGCQNGDLTFFRFSFSNPLITGNAPAASSSSIVVTPYSTPTEVGFFFSAPQWQLSNPMQVESASYSFGYSVDPPPVILGESLFGDPFYGNVTVKENICANDVLVNGCVLGLPYSQSVTPANIASSVYFPYAVPFVDLQLQVNLNASPGNGAGLDAIQTGTLLAVVATPEPTSLLFVSFGLLVLFTVTRYASLRAN